MSIESKFHQEFDALCKQYEAFGYVVLDEGLIEAIKALKIRYSLAV